MRKLEFDRYGPPEVLKLREVQIPEPGGGEVLLRITATAINPSDVKNVAGHFGSPLPRVPGRDYAGVVVAGEAETGLEVWGSGAGFGVARDGAHAEYVTVPAEWISERPRSLSMEEAAAIGVPYVTAWSALVRAGAIKPAETVLIVGVSGAVGRAATQIAHWKGARVIGASRGPDNPSGADAVIDTTTEALDQEVRALTDGKGADLVLDAVGGPMFEPSLLSLRIGGRQVAITSPKERRVAFDLVDFYHNSSQLIGVDTMKLTGAEIREIMDELGRGFDSGHLHPPAVSTWPLERAAEAYHAVERGGSHAKQVLVP